MDRCRSLLQAPDRQRLKGRRDRAILAILLSVGLHQAEAAKLQSRDVQQRKAHWALVDLMRKGRHIRSVPVPDWVNAAPYEGTRRGCRGWQGVSLRESQGSVSGNGITSVRALTSRNSRL